MNYNIGNLIARILLGLVIFACLLYIWDKSQSRTYRIDAYSGSAHAHYHVKATSYSGALRGIKCDSVKIVKLDR